MPAAITGNVPSLQQFLQVAASSGENSTIRSTNKGLSSTGLPTWASTNQKTMSNFISALKAEFGSKIADAAADKLNTLTESGNKPLKAFMVRETVDDAIRTTQANLNVRDKFFSGIDPAHNFEAKFTEMLQNTKEFPIPFDEEGKAAFKEALLNDIKGYALQSGTKITTESLENYMVNLSDTTFAAKLLASPSVAMSALPGSSADKMSVADLMCNHKTLCTVTMSKLPQCRMLQPEGQLTRAAMWQAVIGSPTPEDMEKLPGRNFCDAMENAFSKKLEETVGSKEGADRIMSCLSNVKLESAIDIVKTGRPLTKDDYISSYTRLAVCAKNANTNYAERAVAKDICRIGTTNKNGQPAFAGVHFHSVDGTVETMPFGKIAKENFAFRDEADKAAFASGSLSSFSQQLLDKCRTICEGREEQAQALLSLFNQAPLRAFAAVGYSSEIGSLIPSEMNEHMATMYEVSPQSDGSVRMEIRSNEASEITGRGTMTVSVGKDGTLSMESCKVESADNVKEQNMRDMISDLIAAPTLPAHGKAILAKLAGDMLAHDGLHKQDPAAWKEAIETQLAELQGNKVLMESLQPIPQKMDTQTAQKISKEMENDISNYYKKSYDKMNENGIFPMYIADAIRGSVASINGESQRLVSKTHSGPVPLDSASGLPSNDIRNEALQEQLMDAIPDKKLRGFVSQVASQAGLEGSLATHLAGVQNNSTLPWSNYVNTMDLIANSSGKLNHGYDKHKYTITADELAPGRLPDDPVNEGRGIHIQLNITQGVETLHNNDKFSGDMVNFTIRMDIPYNQPPRGEDEPPVFHISALECQPA